jgi:hypothetical protein
VKKEKWSGRDVGAKLIIYDTVRTFDLLAIVKGSSRTIMLFYRLPKEKVLRAFLQYLLTKIKSSAAVVAYNASLKVPSSAESSRKLWDTKSSFIHEVP